MKKRLLTLFVAMTMTAMLITGCGEKEETKGDVKASVEESKEEDKEDSEEESKDEVEEVAESSEEVVESSEEVEESTEEVVESTEESEEVAKSTEETDETDDEITSVDADGKDWSKAYDDYFQRDDVMSDKVQFNCTAMAEDITFDLIVAMADGNVRMGYVFEDAVFDMYATKEKVYAYYEMQGQSQWVWAPVGSEEEVDSMLDMSDTGMVDTESVESVTYREALKEDGVIYDLVDVVSKDGTPAVFFINRETQKIEKCVSDQDGVSMVILIEEIDSVEFPADAENSATETTMDEILMSMFGVIMAGSGAMAQ